MKKKHNQQRNVEQQTFWQLQPITPIKHKRRWLFVVTIATQIQETSA
jgi:hypothetical protein